MRCRLVLGLVAAFLLALPPARGFAQLGKIRTVWLIVMENHNWTGNNAGAAFGDPDLDGSPLAPFINGPLLATSAHAEQYFNPPGNHPSQPNYLWLEAGTNFEVLADTQPGRPQLYTTRHLVALLQAAGISWKNYAEPDFGSREFDVCPLNFTYLDVEHLASVYFNDINDGLNPHSAECIDHVRPYSEMAIDLANRTSARFNLIIPNLCHDGHEGISPCPRTEPADNTLRGDEWLGRNVPLILNSEEYKKGGALFVTWDEAEDSGRFADGPIGMFILSPFAKGRGVVPYSNRVHYDHSSMLKTMQEIFGAGPLLRAAGKPTTADLSDFFVPEPPWR